MDRLHCDALLQIAMRIYYPTELINLALVSRAFRYLGVDERLFRAFWLREFQQFCPDFILNYQKSID